MQPHRVADLIKRQPDGQRAGRLAIKGGGRGREAAHGCPLQGRAVQHEALRRTALIKFAACCSDAQDRWVAL